MDQMDISHNLKHKSHENQISKGDVVLIKGDAKNRGKWNIGIVQNINKWKDGNIRSAKLWCKKAILEQAIHIYIEWNWRVKLQSTKGSRFGSNARDFSTKRNAAVAVNEPIKEVKEHETELSDVE